MLDVNLIILLHTLRSGCRLTFPCCFLYIFKIILGEEMKSLFAILLTMTALNVTVVFADESLPEIAPVDDPAPPAIDAPAEE